MADPTLTIPTVIDVSGAVPATPQQLRDNLLALAESIQPGVTGTLPGTLIEDIASTDVGALLVSDSLYVDLINSISPTNANPFILIQLGALFGIPQGIGSNASVFVVFTGSSPGFAINAGFTVTDGTNQYVVQDGGIVGAGNVSSALFCIAKQSGDFAIPAGSVNQLVTSVPSGYTLTCSNPTAGLPQTVPQTIAEYRAQIIQAWQATVQGMPQFIKTQLGKVSGINPRLISVQQAGAKWVVMAGGGDPYAIAYAIFKGIPDINILTGSSLEVVSITNANPGVVTTNISHGYTTGDTVTMSDATGLTVLNGTPVTATVTSPYSFSVGVNTTGSGAYTGNGVMSPNLRNQTYTVYDAPDTYAIQFVIPLQQAVGIALTWNTQGGGAFVNSAAISALAVPALVGYINSIPSGSPINIFDMQAVFQQSVADILPTVLITRMQFVVTVNGVAVTPLPGTGVIPGDAFSYFLTNAGSVTVVQG